jgi:predicted nuclease of predicted toxin-antitoxin system
MSAWPRRWSRACARGARCHLHGGDSARRIRSRAIARAHHDGRLLLTEDKDFGELVFRWNWPVPGVVLLRIDPEKNLLKWVRLRAAIETFGERIYGRYTVVEATRFRSRPLHGSRGKI